MSNTRHNRSEFNKYSYPKSKIYPNKVIDLLAYHVSKNISQTGTRDLAIVIGKAQTGKSVLINTLCGVEFCYDSDSGALKPKPNSKLVAKVGDKKQATSTAQYFQKFIIVRQWRDTSWIPMDIKEWMT